MSGEGLPLLQDAGDGNMGHHLQSDHYSAGDSSQAEWSQQWTNFGSEGDLEVFLFKLDDKKIRISTIFPEAQAAKLYLMKKMGRGYHLIPSDQSDVIEVINLDSTDNVTTPEGLILEAVSKVTAGAGKEIGKNDGDLEMKDDVDNSLVNYNTTNITNITTGTKTQKVSRSQKRNRNSTECRDEWRPQIKRAKNKAIDIDRNISELESRCLWIFGILKEIIGLFLSRENVMDVLLSSKMEISEARNGILDVIVNKRIVDEKAKVKKAKKAPESSKRTAVENKMKLHLESQKALIRADLDSEDLRMILEESVCSKAYLDKIVAFVECQSEWLETLQTVVPKLEDGAKHAKENNKMILKELKMGLAELKGTFQSLNPAGSLDDLGLTFKFEKQQKVSVIIIFHQ